MATDEAINRNDFERLIDAIKHPIVQVRPFEEVAQQAIDVYTNIFRSLRTVFRGPFDPRPRDKY